jgi:uncharacterized ATP-binding protein UU034
MAEEDFIKIIEVDESGKLKHRENTKLEFKANYNKNDLITYSKTMAAFANKKGGYIVFGISDNPRKANGMTNDNFENIDNKDISEVLNSHFSPEIEFETYSFSYNGKKFGIFKVSESNNKPIVCIKTDGKKDNKPITSEGDIFYRYSARSERIKYPDLKSIFDNNIELERLKWMEHIEKIATIGPRNVKMLDLIRGKVVLDSDRSIVLDKELLKNIKFVEEGKFVEKDGAPTLKLVGEIQNGELICPKINLEDDYYTAKDLFQELDLNFAPIYMQPLVREFGLDKQNGFMETKKGNKYYSIKCLEYLRNKKLTNGDIKLLCKKYKN